MNEATQAHTIGFSYLLFSSGPVRASIPNFSHFPNPCTGTTYGVARLSRSLQIMAIFVLFYFIYVRLWITHRSWSSPFIWFSLSIVSLGLIMKSDRVPKLLFFNSHFMWEYFYVDPRQIIKTGWSYFLFLLILNF